MRVLCIDFLTLCLYNTVTTMSMQESSFFNFKQDTQKLLLIAGGMLVVLAIGIVVVFSQSAAKVERILQLRQQLAANQVAFNQLSSLQAERVQAESILRNLKLVFPDEEALFTLTGFLQQTAQKNHVQENFAFGAEYQGDARIQKNIGFTMTAQATLSDFASYLHVLEQAPFFVDFGNLEINKGAQTYQFNTLGRIILR